MNRRKDFRHLRVPLPPPNGFPLEAPQALSEIGNRPIHGTFAALSLVGGVPVSPPRPLSRETRRRGPPSVARVLLETSSLFFIRLRLAVSRFQIQLSGIIAAPPCADVNGGHRGRRGQRSRAFRRRPRVDTRLEPKANDKQYAQTTNNWATRGHRLAAIMLQTWNATDRSREDSRSFPSNHYPVACLLPINPLLTLSLRSSVSLVSLFLSLSLGLSVSQSLRSSVSISLSLSLLTLSSVVSVFQ